MDLPNLFSNSTKVTADSRVLFILISEIKIKTVLLELSIDGIEVLSQSLVTQYDSIDTCVTQVDSCLQQLGKESESINEVIFGVPASFVKDKEVVDEKKPLLKKITDDLTLQPLGFIDISEAINDQQIGKNSLFSGLVVIPTKSDLAVSLIHQGKIKAVELVGRSRDLSLDFIESVARLGQIAAKGNYYLPSKIVLTSFDLDEDELRVLQQKIYDTDWNEHKQFIQPATVEILPTDQFIQNVSQEAGRAAALQKNMPQVAFAASTGAPITQLDSAEMGFSDALKTQKELPTSFGIPISESKVIDELEDIAPQQEKAVEFDLDSEFAVDLSDKSQKNDGVVPHKKGFFAGLLSSSSKKKTAVADTKHAVSTGENSLHKHTKKFVLLGFFLGILGLVAVTLIGARVLGSTTVTITPKSMMVSKDIEITLDTKASETDVEKLIIKAGTITKTGSTENTIQTTGIKIIGEKAKGKVAVYNKTDAVKTLSKGTVLKKGTLEFELDQDISIASASSSQGTTVHGKTETTVTSKAIGAEANLTDETELTIVPFDTSTYNAFVLDDGLTGGSSREVRVVSQKDLDELLADSKEELIKTLNEELQAESGSGTYVLPTKSVVSQKATYDAKVEGEAEKVTLKLDMTVEALTYTGSELKPLAQKILESELPENYRLVDEDPQILSSPSQSDLDSLEAGEVIKVAANISSQAVAQLSTDALKEEIKGKSLVEAQELLTSKPEVAQAELTASPSFLRAFIKSVARSLDKITISIVGT